MSDVALTAPDRLECRPTGMWMFRIIGGSILTFGILGLIWGMAYRALPRFLDGEGVTLRDGRKFRWADLQKITHRKVVYPIAGVQLDYFLELRFAGCTVALNPGELANGGEAIRFVERTLGIDARTHMAAYQRR